MADVRGVMWTCCDGDAVLYVWSRGYRGRKIKPEKTYWAEKYPPVGGKAGFIARYYGCEFPARPYRSQPWTA